MWLPWCRPFLSLSFSAASLHISQRSFLSFYFLAQFIFSLRGEQKNVRSELNKLWDFWSADMCQKTLKVA